MSDATGLVQWHWIPHQALACSQTAMPTYRVYFLDEGAHISRPAVIIECANNDEAKQRARQYIDGKDIEVWREGTLIARFPAK
jgi:hypothetical protein